MNTTLNVALQTVLSLAAFTETGETHKGRELLLSPQGVAFKPWDSAIPRTAIAEIRVRHRGRLFSVIEFDVDPFNLTTDFLLLPFALALDAVTTPPVIIAESIRRLGSTKLLYKAAP